MILQTERMNIRLSSDDEMRELILNEKDEGMKQAYGEMFSCALENPGERQWYAVWFIEDKGGNRLGDLCFKGLSSDGNVEIGYGILPEYWGNGYMTEAVKAVSEWAFLQTGVNCITAETEEDNIASQKVLIKSGFIKTGEYGEEGPIFTLSKYKTKEDK